MTFPSFIHRFYLPRKEIDPKDYVRVIKGECVWDGGYGWFIRLFSGKVIWFHREDVCGLRIDYPPVEVAPFQPWYSRSPIVVRLLVECEAREHPQWIVC